MSNLLRPCPSCASIDTRRKVPQRSGGYTICEDAWHLNRVLADLVAHCKAGGYDGDAVTAAQQHLEELSL